MQGEEEPNVGGPARDQPAGRRRRRMRINQYPYHTINHPNVQKNLAQDLERTGTKIGVIQATERHNRPTFEGMT